MKKTKSMFIRDIECPICRVKGSLQILNRNTLNTNRLRHYIKLNEYKKPMFRYCSVDREFVLKVLAEKRTKPDLTKPDLKDETTNYKTTIQDDQKPSDLGLNIFTKNNYANALEKFS